MLAGVLTAAMCCGMMAGCGKESYEQTAEVHFYGIEQMVTAFSAEISNFKKQYSDVKVSLDTTAIPLTAEYAYDAGALEQYYEQTRVALMKGQNLDLMMMDSFYQICSDPVTPLDFDKMKTAGAFADILPIMQSDGSEAEYNADILKMISADDKLYTLPLALNYQELFTTKQLMEQYDFPFDANDTLLTFLQKCSDWQDAHADDPDAPKLMSVSTWNNIWSFAFAISGLNIVDFSAQTANFNTEEVKTLLSCLKNIKPQDNDGLTGFFSECLDGKILFANGLTGISDTTRLEGGDELLLLPLRRADGKITAYTMNQFAIGACSENKLNAYHLAKSLTTIDDEGKSKAANQGVGTFYLDESKEDYAKRMNALSSDVPQSYKDTRIAAYDDVVEVASLPVWPYLFEDLFEDYFADRMSLDELTENIQSKLAVYASE